MDRKTENPWPGSVPGAYRPTVTVHGSHTSHRLLEEKGYIQSKSKTAKTHLDAHIHTWNTGQDRHSEEQGFPQTRSHLRCSCSKAGAQSPPTQTSGESACQPASARTSPAAARQHTANSLTSNAACAARSAAFEAIAAALRAFSADSCASRAAFLALTARELGETPARPEDAKDLVLPAVPPDLTERREGVTLLELAAS